MSWIPGFMVGRSSNNGQSLPSPSLFGEYSKLKKELENHFFERDITPTEFIRKYDYYEKKWLEERNGVFAKYYKLNLRRRVS